MLKTPEAIFFAIFIFVVVVGSFDKPSCFPHNFFVFIVLVPKMTTIYRPPNLENGSDSSNEDFFIEKNNSWAATIIISFFPLFLSVVAVARRHIGKTFNTEIG